MPLIENVTMNAFAEGRKTCGTVILPCGAVEEHGSHLPLGTDVFHAVALAREVSRVVDVWVAPPIYYGLCRSGSQHPGTIGIQGSTLQVLVEDILHSFYRQGLRNVLVLSGHAGGTHMAALADACERVLAEFEDLKIAVLSVLDIGAAVWTDLIDTPGDSHAGEVETALMLHLHPEFVTGKAPEEYPSFPKHILVRNKRAFWPGGVWGNPAAGNAEKGKLFMERSVKALVELIGQLETWSEPPGADPA
jgi:creatinine amidohydrolase